jgi:hypothetical protein
MDISKRVWENLSSINVNKNTEKKGRFTYLSWTWAWSVMMEEYPNTTYTFSDRAFPDGTMEVTCELTVVDGDESVARSMWLPVMSGTNVAIKNPSACDVNKARMRALVKALAMFGLGIYIYAGEDLPDPDSVSRAEKTEQEARDLDYSLVCDLHRESIDAIKLGLSVEDMAQAGEAWFELEPDAKEALWRAPSKGGVFTKKERDVIKSSEFRIAYYGEPEAA